MFTILSKRRPIIKNASLWHRFTITVGVFLVVAIFAPQATHAQGFSLDIGSNNTVKPFDYKKDLLDKQAKKLEVVKVEATKVAEAKAVVTAQVDTLKAELEQLNAQLAEKRRLDALRIVPEGVAAPNSGGNTYAAGNCTWYAKSKRPDLPNRMGNAMFWYAAAKANGFKTGTVAKTRAVGVSFAGWAGHVVYVEKWLGDGQILISEMNAEGLYVQSSRIASESEFVYIYEKT